MNSSNNQISRRFFLGGVTSFPMLSLSATRSTDVRIDQVTFSFEDFSYRTPIKFGGYAVSFRGGHAHVRIEQETFKDLKAFFSEHACHWSAERLEAMLRKLPFEPYAPVRGQLFELLRAVNRKRKTAGLKNVAFACLRLKRRIVRPFGCEFPAAA